MRHVELRWLWVQEVVKEGRLTLHKVDGKSNVADHLTKPIGREEMAEKIGWCGGTLVVAGGKGGVEVNMIRKVAGGGVKKIRWKQSRKKSRDEEEDVAKDLAKKYGLWSVLGRI